MKRFLLIFLCFFLFISCSSAVKTNSLVGVGVSESEIETLPVTADLVVSEYKVTGEATGKITDLKNLTQEALAKALWQETPSVDKPDVLVGQHAFTEVNDANLKVTLTGYPAYYTNFRTATKDDSLRLNMVHSGPSVENKPEIGNMYASGGEWYFSIKYQFGDGFGWGLGAGKVWPSNLLHGDFFMGLEIEEVGLISPWKSEGEWWSSDGGELLGFGGSLNAGGIYGELPYDLKIVYGLSIGFWFSEYSYDGYYTDSWGYRYSDYDSHENADVMLGPFAKVRWHGLEAGLRLLGGTDSEIQFAIGYTL